MSNRHHRPPSRLRSTATFPIDDVNAPDPLADALERDANALYRQRKLRFTRSSLRLDRSRARFASPSSRSTVRTSCASESSTVLVIVDSARVLTNRCSCKSNLLSSMSNAWPRSLDGLLCEAEERSPEVHCQACSEYRARSSPKENSPRRVAAGCSYPARRTDYGLVSMQPVNSEFGFSPFGTGSCSEWP